MTAQMTPQELQSIRAKFPNLLEERIIEYREAFGVFDNDGNGTIDADELYVVLKRVGGKQYFDREMAIKMVESVDRNGDKRIDFMEFVDLMSRSVKTEHEELQDAFNVFDVDGDGKITAEEIRVVLQKLGQFITTEEIQFIMEDVDTDHDGNVSFAEFEAMMMFGPRSRKPAS
eukprot:c7285_g1_i1.p1 GENE.c7285_g1_i1~~c7285_g1_i1.p1  ORF type:complete len:186 (+),score=48.00 c7285_g1_i1:42-560(+)